MKRFGTAFAVALVALCAIAGCNDYGNTFQNNTGALLTSLSPSTVTAGGSDFTIQVMGAGFVAKTVVQWNEKNLVTTVNTDTAGNVLSVTAVVPAALTATPGKASVNTLNPKTSNQDNGLSNSIAFIITEKPNPVPTITGISPTSAAPGSGDVALTVTGSNFINIAKVDPTDPPQVSVVNWNSGATQTMLPATVGSASQITATVPASLLAAESCAVVTVFNPAAVDESTHQYRPDGGGGTSPHGLTFTVSTNASFCPAASQASQSNAAVAIAQETPAVSLDGRFVAYTGTPNGQGSHSQIFLRDTCEGVPKDCKPQTTVLSAAQDNADGNGDSNTPSISSDGRYVAFSSAATNLAESTPSGRQIFLRDTCNGADPSCKPQTQLVSVDPSGLLSATDNLLPSISASGRYIAFLSVSPTKTSATAASKTNAPQTSTSQSTSQSNSGVRQVFIRDTCIGAASGCTPKTTRISTQPGDANSSGGKPAGPAISASGSGVGITDNHSATLFTRAVAVDDRVFLAITKSQN
jgi:trimeric autotransporter adhesin